MRPDPNNIDFDRPPRWHLHFSLKTTFLLLTLFAMWLGVYVFRARQADIVLKRAAAIYGILAKNLMTTPEETVLITSQPPVGFHEPVLNRRSSARSGRFLDSQLAIVALRLSKALASASKDKIHQQLMHHYAKHLDDHGLIRQVDADSQFIDSAEAVETWLDPVRSKLTVSINVLSTRNGVAQILVKTDIDQPVFTGGYFTGMLLAMVVFWGGFIILRVVLTSMFGWGWFEQLTPKTPPAMSAIASAGDHLRDADSDLPQRVLRPQQLH